MSNYICFGADCSPRNTTSDEFTAHQTAVVITPFIKPIVDLSHQCNELPNPNYTDYDLFCVRTKLDEYIRRTLDRSYSSVFAGYPFEGAIRLFLNVIRLGQFLPISQEIADKLQTEIGRATSHNKSYCLLLSAYDVIGLPLAWVKTILPFASLDTIYHYYYDDEKGHLYIAFDPNVDYPQLYNDLYSSLINWLNSSYRAGVVLLDREYHKAFIANWDLVMVDGEQEDQMTLYQPDWSDSRFAPDPYQFLMDRLAHLPIDITIGNELFNLTTRHGIAKALDDEVEYRFHRDKVHLYADSLVELQSYMNDIEIGQTQGPNKVAVVTVINTAELQRYLDNITRVYPGADTITYDSERYPPKVLSFSIPLSDTTEIAVNAIQLIQ